MYNDTLDYIADKESRGEIIVLRPPEKLDVGKVEKDPKKLKAAYEIGRSVATEQLDRIKEYLK